MRIQSSRYKKCNRHILTGNTTNDPMTGWFCVLVQLARRNLIGKMFDPTQINGVIINHAIECWCFGTVEHLITRRGVIKQHAFSVHKVFQRDEQCVGKRLMFITMKRPLLIITKNSDWDFFANSFVSFNDSRCVRVIVFFAVPSRPR